MKKILLSIMIFIVSGFTINAYSQTCNPNVPVIKYTNGSKTGVAPFLIGESPLPRADWETHILGPAIDITSPTPYNPPAASGANWSQDGINGAGDLDSPQAPRDLRFFAFTYDDYNVYFYFRRINNSSSQNTFMYLLDVNADGFMNNGEPVIRANFNASSVSAFGIHQYIVDVSSDYVAGKGNYMTKPTAPNAGLADGYSVKGDISAAVSLAAFPLLANEIFAASPTGDGYGTEFAVPWRYLRNWINPGSNTPLTPGDVFTYHALTQNGTGATTTDKASDNAGGCCSGLASVGDAKYSIDPPVVISVIPSLEYNIKIKVNNTGNAPAKVALDLVSMGNIVQFAGRPINEMDFVVKGYIDANANGIVDGADASTLKIFTYSTGTFASQPIEYLSPTPKDTVILPVSGSANFLVNIRLPLNFSVKSLEASFNTTGVLNLPLGPCQRDGVPQQAPALVGITTPLPVDFKSFTATRVKANVMLKWVTATEKNNDGFAVERNVNGAWEQVAYVNSQALSGNSDLDLSYQYIDYNNAKGISQYRIRQVDFDSKSKYTEIRSVKGDGQLGSVIVYPNPSADGRINVVFEDGNVTRDISVIDMSGRIIKQISGIANNNITIDNLMPGMYSLRVFESVTGEQTVLKVIVSKR